MNKIETKKFDDNPEWTQADINQSLSFEEMPKPVQQLVTQSALKKRGRPTNDNKKVSVTIRYSASVIEAFKATGKGWQSRMNQVLEEYIAKAS